MGNLITRMSCNSSGGVPLIKHTRPGMQPMLGIPSANALWLGDPTRLDERCSLEVRSPDLRDLQAFSGFGFILLPGFCLPPPTTNTHR